MLKGAFSKLSALVTEVMTQMDNDEMLAAAEEGVADAQYYMGTRHLNGTHGCEKDIGKAREWLKKAADQGHDDARNAVMALPWDRSPASAPEAAVSSEDMQP